MFFKLTKILVSRDERRVMVKTRLRNQGIANIGFKSAASQFGACLAGPAPIAFLDLEKVKIIKQRSQQFCDLDIRQQFRDDNRRQSQLTATHRLDEMIHVAAGFASEQCRQ